MFHNCLVHITLLSLSSDAFNSDSVELLELCLYLVELNIIAPFLSVNIILVWVFMSGCTTNTASTYHIKVCVLATSNMRILSRGPLKKPFLLTYSSRYCGIY